MTHALGRSVSGAKGLREKVGCNLKVHYMLLEHSRRWCRVSCGSSCSRKYSLKAVGTSYSTELRWRGQQVLLSQQRVLPARPWEQQQQPVQQLPDLLQNEPQADAITVAACIRFQHVHQAGHILITCLPGPEQLLVTEHMPWELLTDIANLRLA